MKKTLFVFTTILFFALALSACKKDEINNNGSNNVNQEYPSTDHVLPNAVTDIDGNSYDAVQIGDQVWMAENLRTTRYANGTTIPLGGTFSGSEQYRYAPGLSQSNEENMANVARYGYLYNWSVVYHGGICPNGWHVPSIYEWEELTKYMAKQSTYTASGDPEHLAKALAATWGWNSSSEVDAPGNNPATNNATGFSSLPAGKYGGVYNGRPDGKYDGFGDCAFYWSTSPSASPAVYCCELTYDNAYVKRFLSINFIGMSVRCVRD